MKNCMTPETQLTPSHGCGVSVTDSEAAVSWGLHHCQLLVLPLAALHLSLSSCLPCSAAFCSACIKYLALIEGASRAGRLQLLRRTEGSSSESLLLL